MTTLSFKVLAGGALPFAVCAALIGAAADVEARGRRGGSSSGSKHTSAKADHDAADSSGTSIHLRGSSTSSNASTGNTQASNGFVPPLNGLGRMAAVQAGNPLAAPLTPEEEARRAALLATYEREQQDKLAAQKSAAERQEADRQARDRAVDQRAAQQKADERAAAARVAAEADRKKREQANVNAEADRILQRAMADYPMLRTPQGQVVLERILDRQKVLQERGMYPSMAMVEAVADHAFLLTSGNGR